MFIALEGLDGAGKSTQIARLGLWLQAQQWDVVRCRDPGSTALGDAIREILLHRSAGSMGMRSEMLLYMAARSQLVDQVIRPALDRGAAVVSDRFLLSNIVYQGYAGGLPPETLWQVGLIATGGLLPDRTFVLDLPPEEAIARMQRPLDHLERRSLEYRQAVREGFLTEAQRNPERVSVVSATGSPEEVWGRLEQAISSWLQNRS